MILTVHVVPHVLWAQKLCIDRDFHIDRVFNRYNSMTCTLILSTYYEKKVIACVSESHSLFQCCCCVCVFFCFCHFLRSNSRLYRIKVCRGYASSPFLFFTTNSMSVFWSHEIVCTDYKLCIMSTLFRRLFSYPHIQTNSTKCIWHSFSFHAFCVQ